ncbi:ADP-ribose pyrophosphatase, mitochondrial-like isoform X3 [Hemitrygon akajei]|uniref:ADP-ribose pyrophosphatase, mitochondrial-like isoform X3 n=1 Tax=Hemitrygon akajei TaxID=2704970 RepID=UPI003BF958A3
MWRQAVRVVKRLAALEQLHHRPLFKARCVGVVPLMEILEFLHVKARGEVYPGSEICRFLVPDNKVGWDVPWTDYDPVDYTASLLLKQPPWADPPYRNERELIKLLKFNHLDGDVDRRSYTGKYEVINGFPRNPCGRTGLKGRGLLGRWGPNHAADPIVTRWKKEGGKTVIHNCSGKPILQFVAICRRDNKEWAIPGVYKGYVDDPRNTDNAWMETVAMNFHDETGDSVGKLNLQAGDDAGAVKWMDIEEKQKLYASHTDFLHQVARAKNAHW